MEIKAKNPIKRKSEHSTLTGNPPLGYLNSYYCPVCGRHLFSHYDADVIESRDGRHRFWIGEDWNYCSKCGTLLELSKWKRKEKRVPIPGIITGADYILEFSE